MSPPRPFKPTRSGSCRVAARAADQAGRFMQRFGSDAGDVARFGLDALGRSLSPQPAPGAAPATVITTPAQLE